MHTGPVPGSHTSEWKPTQDENPQFVCRKCKSHNVWHRRWESSCGGYDDIHYHCRDCNREWWVEGPDA